MCQEENVGKEKLFVNRFDTYIQAFVITKNNTSMTSYQVFSAFDFGTLSGIVSSMMAQGFTPIGGVAVANGPGGLQFYQAMVR